MRISTKGRYGLRAMFELARGFGNGPLLMSAIAERQGLSRKHLHSLLSSLKSAGLVKSVRGPGGGFVLSRMPGQIRLSEVLRALEGPLAVVHCVPDKRECERADGCVARGVWKDLTGAIEEVLDGVTLEDLAGREAHRSSDGEQRNRSDAALQHASQSATQLDATSRRRGSKAGKK